MANIIDAVRSAFENKDQLNEVEIFTIIQKSPILREKVSKEELQDVLNHYRNLQVIYMDEARNVIFL